MSSLVASSEAFATLTVKPVTPWVMSSSNVIHYQADPVSALMDSSAGFRNFDLTATQSESGNANALLFDLTSTGTFSLSGTQRLVVSAFATMGTGDPVAIPLALGQAEVCSSSNENCQSVVSSSGTDYFLAARSTSNSSVTNLRIGIYPKDLCAIVNAQSPGHDAQGCTSGVINSTFSSSIPLQFLVTFAVGVAADSSSGFALSAAAEKTSETTLSFYQNTQTFSCPSMSSVYFPGDGMISIGPGFTASDTTGAPPADTLVVVAKKGGTPTTTSSFATENDVVGRVDLTTGGAITGFTNTTTGADNSYSLAFSVRDASGRMAAFDSSPSCTLSGVQTSEIQGFLKSSQCFIATGAFRSAGAAPVRLLREFRDEILLQMPAGKAFVDWYYGWSPPAANWVIQNPVARVPVLFFLAPLEVLAWVCLNPFLLAGLVLAVFGLHFFLRHRREQA